MIVLSASTPPIAVTILANRSGSCGAWADGELQIENIRESVSAGQVVPIKEPTPLGSYAESSQAHNSPIPAFGARSVMNNFYGVISATDTRLTA